MEREDERMIRACSLFIVVCLAAAAFGDKTYSQNKRANRLFDKGKYEEALKIYDDAILEAPADQKLKMNKGSALYRLNQFDKAEEAYNSAQDIKDKNALADLCFNRGNALFREGQQQMQQGGQGAQEKLKGALDNYIKTLDLRSTDRDAKWNLQLTQELIKRAQQQQNKDKNQQNNNEKPKPPSENAKKIKAEADRLVANREYAKAFDLMSGLLKTDQTAAAYADYTKRLNDVVSSQ
jgi:tetratricopeptide (TPR) repeat protein